MQLNNKQLSVFKKTLINRSNGVIKDILYYTISKSPYNSNKFCNLYVDLNEDLSHKELKEQLSFDTSKFLSYILGDSDIKQVNFRVVNAGIHKGRQKYIFLSHTKNCGNKY